MTVLAGVETGLLPAAAGPRAAGRLAGRRRRAAIVHRGHDAVYLDLDGWCLGVVRDPAVRVPCALVLATDAALDLARVGAAQVSSSALTLDETAVRVTRFRDVRVPRLAAIPDRDVVEVLLAHATAAVDEIGPRPDLDANVGRGSGLTPLGDDVLSGWLATSYALGAPATTTYDVRGRTTLLSATLVDCAARGEVLPQFRDVVMTLSDPHAADLAAARLAGVGHTSGAGLLLGTAMRLAA